jgi:hypothetical protein
MRKERGEEEYCHSDNYKIKMCLWEGGLYTSALYGGAFSNLSLKKLQGDSEGKVNIFGSCCGIESSYKHVPNSERLPRCSCLNLQDQLHRIFVCGVG